MNKQYPTKRELIIDKITMNDSVLDIGFYGQGQSTPNSPIWHHRFIKEHCKEIFGLDHVLYTPPDQKEENHYFKGSAENFDLNTKVDRIFAGDLIEHLVNIEGFLDSCKRHLQPNGLLLLTTPNAFNFYNFVFKVFFDEPGVNKDHTCYFNKRTIETLLTKCGWQVTSFDYVIALELNGKKNWKLKLVDAAYTLVAKCVPKFSETLVITAKPLTEQKA